jgi:hypothetical protein
MFQHAYLVLHQKRLDRQCIACRCAVMVKNPLALLPHFRSSSSHPFTKDCQNLLIVDLVNGLTFRHLIIVNNSLDIKKRSSLLWNLTCSSISPLPSLNLLNHSKLEYEIDIHHHKFHQQTICFYSEFSKFCEEFHIDTLLYSNTQHNSDRAQIHGPLQTKAATTLLALWT